MVIWLFSGGGESELGSRENNIKGIVNFFEKYFSDFTFIRITPVRNKRLPPNVKSNPINALGKTGESLAKQITIKLEDAIKYKNPICDAILVLDDLDCCCSTDRTKLFNNAINEANKGSFKEIERIIGFAAPELESWIIADWDNTIAKYIDFRENHKKMQYWLATNKVSFDTPESFSWYDENKKSCHEKLSDLLIESSRQENEVKYSKSQHTPILLYQYLNPNVVAEKCPIFKDFFMKLKYLEELKKSKS